MAKKRIVNKNKLFLLIFCWAIIFVTFLFVLKQFWLYKHPPVTQIYTGTLPCADCPGIDTTLTLTKLTPLATKGEYTLKQIYKDRNVKPYTTQGDWIITKGIPANKTAWVLELGVDNPSDVAYYLIVDAQTLQMLDHDKQIIDPNMFMLHLVRPSGKSSDTALPTRPPLNTSVFNQLSSWLPNTVWENPKINEETTLYGKLKGESQSGKIVTLQPTLVHFENKSWLEKLGFSEDTNLLADGPGSSVWGYKKTTGAKNQLILFSYQTAPYNTAPDQPLQFACPCTTMVTVFVSNSFSSQ
ncbi:MAG TPA: copper resistance protein NlpE N-terminal domain-containing protein [Methylomirabilota bacterium]|nr:copper resistance protein NlpE N-terminal domain-containing protein [Methylomirabilota bacterium]